MLSCPSKTLPRQGEGIIFGGGGEYKHALHQMHRWPLASTYWSPAAFCIGHGRLSGSGSRQLLLGLELQENKNKPEGVWLSR